MIFCDTNILIYSVTTIDDEKNKESDNLLKNLIAGEKLIISPLVINEFNLEADNE